MARIILVDDEGALLKVLSTVLQVAGGHTVVAMQDGSKVAEMLKTERFDLMISDIRMAPVNGMQLLQLAHDTCPDMQVIMVTAFSSIDTAMKARELGVFDYVPKPFKVDELLQTVNMALKYRDERRDQSSAKDAPVISTDYYLGNIIARSSVMEDVCELIKRIAPTEMPVLILGAKGTGRRLAVETFHSQSQRKNGQLVVVNCEALTEGSFESDFFGSARLGEDGSAAHVEGFIDRACKGTLLLEEVGNISPAMQARLLTILKEKKYMKDGAVEATPTDLRVISSSSEDMNDLVKRGRFKEELFRYLGTMKIRIPALADRKDDILPLAYRFLADLAGETAPPTFDTEVSGIMTAYPWPGNVAELKDTVKAIFDAHKGAVITKASLPSKLAAVHVQKHHESKATNAESFKCANLKRLIKGMRREAVAKVVRECAGDKRKAARELNMSLADLNKELGELGG